MQTASPTRAGLSAVLLFYFLGVILVITLAPFHFQLPMHVVVDRDGGPFDVVANVFLFLPLGFLFPLVLPVEREPSPIEVLGYGMLLSAAIETVQIFEPGRFPSLVDVATNGTGAMLGAIAVRYATRRVRINARHVGRFSLEIPLVGLIYLLLPLLLAASMRAAREPLYLLVVTAVVFITARLLSSVQRYHFGPSNFLTNAEAGFVAGAWILLGTFPMLAAHRVAGAALVVAAGAVTWLQSTHGKTATGERRFEAEALVTVRPLIVAHVLCVALLPLASGFAPWDLRVSLTGFRGDIDLQMLELLVPVATLTVLGYLLAEARGRRELSFGVAIRRIAAECALVALAFEIVRGFEPSAGASVAQFIVTLAAGILGAGIYHSQRQHIRWIIANRGSRAQASAR
jgi:glycopeptide antibiotics resistance protein